MQKGSQMPVAGIRKMRQTKQLRIQKEKVSLKVTKLLLSRKIKAARTLARDNSALFEQGSEVKKAKTRLALNVSEPTDVAKKYIKAKHKRNGCVELRRFNQGWYVCR